MKVDPLQMEGIKMKTILLVDDEALMLDLLSLYLTPYGGYKCLKTKSGIFGQNKSSVAH
jgi:CheY-like chemotaxis protein